MSDVLSSLTAHQTTPIAGTIWRRNVDANCRNMSRSMLIEDMVYIYGLGIKVFPIPVCSRIPPRFTWEKLLCEPNLGFLFLKPHASRHLSPKKKKKKRPSTRVILYETISPAEYKIKKANKTLAHARAIKFAKKSQQNSVPIL